MNWLNAATILVGAILTIAPQFIAILPSADRDAASLVLAAVNGIFHLYQPTPPKPPPAPPPITIVKP